MSELAAILAAYPQCRGYVVAPAGYGKTHLIAESTALSTGRQLILTHTYAGVNALRDKMRALSVSKRLYHIDTIASWSLRLSLSYSGTSHRVEMRPANNDQWCKLYEASCAMLDHAFVRRIVKASYIGLYVDEYQDCSVAQHNIVRKLARDLPCRVLGDPLQGIFDFGKEKSIDWKRDVEKNFTRLGELEIPHRWKQADADELGTWLSKVRTCLEQGQPINLKEGLPETVIFKAATTENLSEVQGKACRYVQCKGYPTVIALHQGNLKEKCHSLARSLGGSFSSIEEVEGKALFSFIKELEKGQTDTDRLKAVITFAVKCMTAVKKNLPNKTLNGEKAKIQANTRNSKAVCMANAYLDEPSSAAMISFLLALEKIETVKITRADLFNRMLGVLRKHVQHPELSLAEAAEKYHSEFRYKGRPVGRRRLVGTTLLVKGLEFDHAIVLDAASLNKKELYVALTRGARSLTIVSTKPVLNPREGSSGYTLRNDCVQK